MQIVEYQTDRPDEMKALRDNMQDEGGTPGFTGLTVTQDRDNPKRWLMIVEFDSYEEAMANSARPETDEMSKKMAALASGPAKFHNLDVRETYP